VENEKDEAQVGRRNVKNNSKSGGKKKERQGWPAVLACGLTLHMRSTAACLTTLIPDGIIQKSVYATSTGERGAHAAQAGAMTAYRYQDVLDEHGYQQT